VLTSLANFPSLKEADFDVILTRESGGRPKPHPDGVLAAAGAMGVSVGELLVVGDFIFDIAAGNAAGAATALLTNGSGPPGAGTGTTTGTSHAPVSVAAVPDHTIARLDELAGIVGL